jgi:hypothetical protein
MTVGVAALAACAACQSITATRLPVRDNPTRWVYSRPLVDVAACLANGMLAADAWGDKTSLKFGSEPLRNEQSYAVTVESEGYGSAAVRSETYLYRSCPLGIYGEWRITASALSSDSTQVQIVPIKLQVHNYECFYIGHPWGCARDVKPSTVEEYRMLLSLGACLNISSMPTVVQPAGSAPQPNTCQ